MHEREDPGPHAGDLSEEAAVDEHVPAAGDEQHDEDVAGEHVAEESQRERHRAGEEVGDQLEQEDHRDDPALGRPGGTRDFQ